MDELKDILADSVKRHLLSDVPLGAFLSGGVDSSLVVALMSEVAGTRVRTFSISFVTPGGSRFQGPLRFMRTASTTSGKLSARLLTQFPSQASC